MGEIAEMMLDGTLCCGCGVYLDGDGDGIPRYCRDCHKPAKSHTPSKPREKVDCPICKKRINKVGLADHKRDVHGEKGQS